MPRQREAHRQVTASITSQLEQVTGLHVSVGLHGRTATLRGRVPSVEARRAILDITAELAPRWRIVDDLDLELALPEAGRHVRIRELDHKDEGAAMSTRFRKVVVPIDGHPLE